jgi:endonuclease III
MKITTNKLKQSQLYSEELGIELKENDQELFKWFLASLLFGGRISEAIAENTYRTFVRYHLVTPQEISQTGWDFLVNPIMREGGYVRYDGRKSTQILRNCKTLLDEYGGSLSSLHQIAENSEDLERRMSDFYGVGPVTVNIFLRELRPYWRKADPEPLPVVKEIARKLNVDLGRYRRKTLAFVRIEAGLMRLRKCMPRPEA